MRKITPKSEASQSADLIAENVEKLKTLFPEAFTEDKIDFDVLKQLLGGTVDEREERYGLNWHGKRKARQLALTPSTGTLRPCPEESVDWDTTQNIMIEGDNLEVLKLLQKSYAGKVKLIYIDPPYNTGKDFVYPDNFQDSIQNYLEITGQIDGAGNRLSANTEASGRFHTDWLNMMYPRLKLMRSLLSVDGVILVSIDDGECHHLRSTLNSIFGIENFLGVLVWQGGRKNDPRLISVSHDYILVYSRSHAALTEKETRWRERKSGLEGIYRKVDELRSQYGTDYEAMHNELLRWYRELSDENPSKAHSHFNFVDGRGVYYPDNLRSPNPRPNLVYEWKGYQPHPNGWAYGRDKMAQLDADDRLVYPDSRDKRIKIKSYLEEHESWALGSVFYKDRRTSSKALKSLMEDEVFDYPKDIDVLSRLIETMASDDAIVLDCFAGSGASGHAVMALNQLKGVNRRFILVQLPEPLDLDDKDTKAAAEYCKRRGKPKNIAELTKERLRLAGLSLRAENSMFPSDLGFRVFKLDTSNIQTWDPARDDLPKSLLDSVDHIKPNRSEQDVLFELLLKLGLDLTVPIEVKTFGGKVVHSIGVGALFVCLDPRIAREEIEPFSLGIVAWRQELNPAGETQVVFRDSAFADDVAKTNLAAILQQNGIETVRSL